MYVYICNHHTKKVGCILTALHPFKKEPGRNFCARLKALMQLGSSAASTASRQPTTVPISAPVSALCSCRSRTPQLKVVS